MKDDLQAVAMSLAGDLVELRHELHRHPEIGLDLPRTQSTVLRELEGLGLEISLGQQLTSVTAVLRGGAAGPDAPAVLLRGDMDALPVTEATGLSYSSVVPGVMHACGHDLHTTMLVGAARLLSAHRAELPGDVVFMFQPGEEGYNGASLMIDEGVLNASGRRADSAYGLHVMSSRYAPGRFYSRAGAMLSASDQLEVTVHGAGTHGALPHHGRDPIVVAAETVTALQAMVTRRFNIFDPVVVTVGQFNGGTRRNIIPETAHLDATVRSFSPESRELMHELSVQLCENFARAHGMRAEVAYRKEFPVTSNDPVHTAFASEIARATFGNERFEPMRNPDAGSEDFSRVLAEVPGCFLFLGAAVDDYNAAATNHSPYAVFSDEVLPDGALMLTQLAISALTRDSATQPPDAQDISG